MKASGSADWLCGSIFGLSDGESAKGDNGSSVGLDPGEPTTN